MLALPRLLPPGGEAVLSLVDLLNPGGDRPPGASADGAREGCKIQLDSVGPCFSPTLILLTL